MYSISFAVGVVIVFLVYTDRGTSRPAATTTVTAHELHERAAETRVREVIKNCTRPCANDEDIVDCLLSELQTCRPKPVDSLVDQYQEIPYSAQAFILSEMPAPRHPGNGRRRYVGFPNRAFVTKTLTNSSCVPRSYKYMDVGDGYFPSTLMVVSECNESEATNSGYCNPDFPCEKFIAGINSIRVLKRDGCDKNGVENWIPTFLAAGDVSEEISLACGCEY